MVFLRSSSILEKNPGFFHILYEWEPLHESDGVSRIIAKASHTPTSGPFQDGDLLAFTVREKRLVVVDCIAGRATLEKEFSEKYILHGLKNGYIFYYLGTKPPAIRTMVLSVTTQKEKAYPGNLVLVTEGGFLVTVEKDIFYIFDPQAQECLFSEPIARAGPIVALGDVVFVSTRDRRHIFSSFLSFAIRSRKSFSLSSLAPGISFYFPEHHGHT